MHRHAEMMVYTISSERNDTKWHAILNFSFGTSPQNKEPI